MVTVGRNPSTNKVLYQSGTGKQCVGCCGGIVPGSPCSFCPTGTTPLQLEVVLSGFDDQCSSAECPFGAHRRSLLPGIASIVNGTHILDQSFTPCAWQKTINFDPIEFLDFSYDDEEECLGGGCDDVDGDEIYSSYLIMTVTKVTATRAEFEISFENAGFTNESHYEATTTGTAKCFETTGWSAFNNDPILFDFIPHGILTIGSVVVNSI